MGWAICRRCNVVGNARRLEKLVDGRTEPVNVTRSDDLKRFYEILAALERKVKGARTLANCSGKMNWPRRGVYFFREVGEERFDTGDGPRIVRVGTHATKAGARSRLWGRLRQHRGTISTGGGNHGSSIFRGHVGFSLIKRDCLTCPSWGRYRPTKPYDIDAEGTVERKVSDVIGAMPFLWLAVMDEPGPMTLRAYIERNAIALLSNFGKSKLDPPSREWLGRWCNRKRVRESGLWNSNHVNARYEPEFLEVLESHVDAMAWE